MVKSDLRTCFLSAESKLATIMKSLVGISKRDIFCILLASNVIKKICFRFNMPLFAMQEACEYRFNAPVNLTRHFLNNRNGRTTKERTTGLNKPIQ